MHKSLTTLNQQAWVARFSGDMDSAHELLVMAKLKLGMSPGAVEVDDIKNILEKNSQKQKLVADTICLLASMERFQGRVNGSNQILDCLESWLKLQGKMGTSNLYLQKGLNQQVLGQYAMAIESYSAATSLSDDLVLKCVSVSNKLLCMESLGIPLDAGMKEVDALLKIAPESPVKDFVMTQMRALKGRQYFRKGHIAEFFSEYEEGGPIGQPDYMRQYVSRLPYVKANCDLRNHWEYFVSQHRHLLKGSFRLRTLLGQHEESDYEKARPCDLADRLYLWVWLWMKDPHGFGLIKIMRLLNQIDLQREIWTFEDMVQIRLALLWLGLFSHVSKQDIIRVTASQPTQHSAMPTFEFERLVLDYLYAKKSRDSLLAAEMKSTLQAHPLWGSSEVVLRDLLELNIESQLNPLALGLSKMMGVLQNDAKFTVDLRRQVTIEPKTGMEHKSQSLSAALAIFQKRGFLSCAELLKEVYGLGKYDPFIHDKKIHNLLYRLRRVVGTELKFHIKCGVVYSEGSWRNFDFILPSQHESDLANFGSWFSDLTESRRESSRRPLRKEPLDIELKEMEGRWISRAQVQKQLSKPRSTTCRLLNEWVKSGMVTKKGNTRNSFYKFKPELIAHLQEEV